MLIGMQDPCKRVCRYVFLGKYLLTLYFACLVCKIHVKIYQRGENRKCEGDSIMVEDDLNQNGHLRLSF